MALPLAVFRRSRRRFRSTASAAAVTALVPLAAACAASVLLALAGCSNLNFLVARRSMVAARLRFSRVVCDASKTSTSTSEAARFYEPAERDAHYGRPLNAAQYMIDLHDAKVPFDFCGGMMFQLMLSAKLRSHLGQVAKGDGPQPVIFDESMRRMAMVPEYTQTAHADNVRVFHGREIRKVPDASGGMGFVLQLSLADGDPEGWTEAEIAGYDGWGHDSGRTWRTGERLEDEGFEAFRSKFGQEAFALHHRCYLHFDGRDAMWLSAEDGCEGEPAGPSLMERMFR